MKISEIMLNKAGRKKYRGQRPPRVKPMEFVVKNIIEDKAGKNLHLTHAEEMVFTSGYNGAKKVLNYFTGLIDTFKGHSNDKVSVTTKWDGAPAIFAGVDPEDGQFFVGTKGVFNANAKLNKSLDDIESNHGDVVKNGENVSKEGLRAKLRAAYTNFKDLGITGVLQGDMLFTKGDIKKATIDGEQVIGFKPNTITYTVPADSELANEMLQAEIGIIFHTTYEGSSMADMSAKFGVDISGLKRSPNVWFDDASIKDLTGQVTFTASETKHVEQAISQANKYLNAIGKETFAFLDSDEAGKDMKVQMLAHINASIKNDSTIDDDPANYAKTFIDRYVSRATSAISKLKTGAEGPAGQKRTAAMQQGVEFLETHRQNIEAIYGLSLRLMGIKMMFHDKMANIKALDSFIEKPDGSFEVTDPEGFVIVDHHGDAVKVVDRLGFSLANFQDSGFGG